MEAKIVPSSQNGMVELTVRDSGCGIPKDNWSRICNLYFSTKSYPDAGGNGGSGLDLALRKKVIEGHH